LQVKLTPFINALFREVNPVPVKAAMELMNLPSGNLRLPLTKAEPATFDLLEKCLKDLGYL
jgi:4-hydroxy-tetrahydrodipicolinate synthase